MTKGIDLAKPQRAQRKWYVEIKGRAHGLSKTCSARVE